MSGFPYVSPPGGAVPTVGACEPGQMLVLRTAGDAFEGQDVTAVVAFTSQNKDVVTIKKGQPVAIHGSGVGIVLAGAALNGMYAVGVAGQDIAVGEVGTVLDDGHLTLADWTNVIGAVSLQAKATYFLSETPGMLDAVPPATLGHISQIVLREIAPDTASLRIESPTLL